jgi:hypothetical protein
VVLRVRTLRALFLGLTILAIPATPALAVSTGGVAAGTSVSGGSSSKGSTPPAVKIHAAPVTSRSPNILYTGPVY